MADKHKIAVDDTVRYNGETVFVRAVNDQLGTVDLLTQGLRYIRGVDRAQITTMSQTPIPPWMPPSVPPDQMEIRLHFTSVCTITVEEYDQIRRDVETQIMAGLASPTTRVLARLLLDQEDRYTEIKHIRAERAERAAIEATPSVNGHKHCTHTSEQHEKRGWTCDYWPVGGVCCGGKTP